MSLLGEPAPDFGDPLGMLTACHQRMLAQCELLDRLPDWIARHGIDHEALVAAERVRRYFADAAPLHHCNEEQDLFPLLADDAGLARLIDTLRRDHAALDANWAQLAAALAELKTGRADPDGLRAVGMPFSASCRAHVAREDSALLPRAATLLDAAQLARIGAAMAARRA
ncbi:MAG: hemerythrin domain-containing protein [Gammaproteobacteria bacterium]|nr:hemerythrin domain-containing protein [Gammaproteobacteria bacterium]